MFLEWEEHDHAADDIQLERHIQFCIVPNTGVELRLLVIRKDTIRSFRFPLTRIVRRLKSISSIRVDKTSINRHPVVKQFAHRTVTRLRRLA
jgi:hypothetical protein